MEDPPLDFEGLAKLLASVLDEIQDEPSCTQAGPTLTDSINARRLARLTESLRGGPEQRPGTLEQLLKNHVEIARWAAKKLETNAGRRDLKALLRIEMS